MAHINPWPGFNSHSATQNAQLQRMNSQMRNMAPGVSFTPPSGFSPNSACQMASFRHQVQRVDALMCNNGRFR